ncbi:unnamed protein product [Nezara viridula]|uniref:Uncharacterized protein n=1 Tax=Nezara viridula TaxID=85310 RepID=A0A9P0HPK0_NEZVI|nr:unnamed protein product [Nezara viridula]
MQSFLEVFGFFPSCFIVLQK